MKGESLSAEGVRVRDRMWELCPILLDAIEDTQYCYFLRLMVCGGKKALLETIKL